MDAKSLALEYYPKYWTKEEVAGLVEFGKLTEEDYKEITGEKYTNEKSNK